MESITVKCRISVQLLSVIFLLSVFSISVLANEMEYIKSEAEAGNVASQVDLGFIYLDGDGVRKDPKKAFDWFLKAAEQGDVLAQSQIGAMYDQGIGVERNVKKAMKWLLLAAKKGDQNAQADLGMIYADGSGGEQSDKKAVHWLLKSVEQGIGPAADAEVKSAYTDAVKGLQILLKDNKAYTGAVDGKYGAATRTAAQRYLANFAIDDSQRGFKVHKSANKEEKGFADGRYVALIIAVKDYEHDAINDLDYPVKDAEKIKAVLKQYRFNDITFLKNPKRYKILGALSKLRRRLSDKDNLLIFYAGHGFWDEDIKQGYWFPSDAEQDNRSQWLSNSDIRDYIRGIKTKNTLLISDACFSGGIFKERAAFKNANKGTKELYKTPSRKAITSGVLKTVPDRSVFLEYLVKRLKQNEKDYLPALELFSSFRTAVTNNSPNQQIPQYGDIREAGDEGGDFIFVRKD